jgi:hypothetical protein
MYITIGDGGNREGLALKYALDQTVVDPFSFPLDFAVIYVFLLIC